MKSRTIVFVLAILLLVAASIGVSANDLSYSSAYSVSYLRQDSLAVDTTAVDSLVISADSLSAPAAKKEAIEAPVFYESSDSMVWSTNGNAFLYGSGKVVYD